VRNPGDIAAATALREYYALMAEVSRSYGGRVVQVVGDGVLLAFRPEQAAEALAALRSAQAAATRRWAALDVRCRGVVRVVTGRWFRLRSGRLARSDPTSTATR
jgi:class 3 adenylate cyclase